jgi:hypothetical protein
MLKFILEKFILKEAGVYTFMSLFLIAFPFMWTFGDYSITQVLATKLQSAVIAIQQPFLDLINELKLELFKELNSVKEEIVNFKKDISKQIQYQFGFEQIKVWFFSTFSLVMLFLLGFILFKSLGGMYHNTELLQAVSKNIIDCFSSVVEIKSQTNNMVNGIHNIQDTVNTSCQGLAKIETLVKTNFQQSVVEQTITAVQEPIINIKVPNKMPNIENALSIAELKFGKKFK